MALDEPLKNCVSCLFGEHFPANGEASKFLCTRVEIGEYFGQYVLEDSEEIEKHFVCHQEPLDDTTAVTEMHNMPSDVPETVLS